MRKLLLGASKLSKILNIIGGVILVLMMFLTVVDVILRYLGRPITGTYELMGFSGALVIGLAIAQTSLDDGHITMDILTVKLRRIPRSVLLVATKLVSLILFALITWALFAKAQDFYKTAEVSLTLRVPYYPVAYGLSLCAFAECVVLFSDILVVVLPGGKHE